jgi:hypothetical protein
VESNPTTLGDWYEILNESDYAEAAMLANDGKPPPPWAATFLMHWAPELINGRIKWDRAQKRAFVLKRLETIEKAALKIGRAMDSEIIKFLQLPPHTPFESELGTQIFVSGLAARARDARNAPNLLTGDGDSHLGAGKAIPPIDPNPKIFCALIIAELWHFLHGSFPKTAKNALGAATSYWAASGGTFNSWSGKPDRSWVPYFDEINNELLRGYRPELRRQLQFHSET